MKKRTIIYALLIILTFLCGCTNQNSAESSAPSIAGTSINAMEIPAQDKLLSLTPTTLEEWVFTNFETNYSWQLNNGETCTVSFRLPAIAPVHDFAINYNSSVKNYAQKYLDEVKPAMESGSETAIQSVDYEAYMFNNILSLCITFTFRDGTHDYFASVCDVENRCYMSTSDLCKLLLDMDYLNFNYIAHHIAIRQFSQAYAHLIPNIPVESMTEEEENLYYEYEDILRRQFYKYFQDSYGSVYLDGEGKIKLITYVPYLTMYLSREVTTDFQISNYSDLIRPTAEIYYDFLTHIPGRGGQGESYYYMLQYVFLDNPTDFVKYASLLTDDEQDHLLMYFFYFDSGYNRESEIHALCEELIKEKSLTAEEKDLITELWLGSI